jgi:hypothetical protein
MAYKINGTTVVDNSRNVCACCVTSCCITATSRMDAPSGTTAQRPSSPATGSVYFDTDENTLLAYDGTQWSSLGGSSIGTDYSSLGLVSSPDQAWGNVYIRPPFEQCKGQGCACVAYENAQCCVTFQEQCFKPLYCINFDRGFADGIYGQVVTQGDQFTNCTLKGLTRHGTPNYNYTHRYCNTFPCDGGTSRYDFGMSIRGHSPDGIPGFNVFNDGSICVLAEGCYNCWCGCNFQFNSYHFDKYGNNFFICGPGEGRGSTSCAAYVPENHTYYVEYINRGKSGPIANLKMNIMSYVPDIMHCIGCACFAFEVCPDYISSWGYQVCDSALAWCTPYSSLCGFTNYYSGAPLFKKETAVRFCNNIVLTQNLVGTMRYGTNCMYNCCCGLSYWNFLSKRPDYNYRDPSFYTPKICSATGVKIGFSYEAATCSMAYQRILTYDCCPNNPFGLYSNRCRSASYWVSLDKCCMFHLYFPEFTCGTGWDCFTCSTEQPLSTAHTIGGLNCSYPALEIINTTNGCVICSVYWRKYYDCQLAGSTYPRPVYGQKGWYRRAPYVAAEPSCMNNTLFGERQGGLDGHAYCGIRSCTCPARVYFFPDQGGFICDNTSLSIFNECTMKFEGSIPVSLFGNNGVCDKMGVLIGGSIGCCCTNACLATAYCCTFPTGRLGNLVETILGYKLAGSNATQCCRLEIRYGSNPMGISEFCKQGITSYINPTNDHLVTFYNMRQCKCYCSFYTVWMGAVCYDLINCCISRVETLYPSPADLCVLGLLCGPQGWGSIHFCDARGSGCAPCICAISQTLGTTCRKVLMQAATWGDECTGKGGVSLRVTPVLTEGIEKVRSTCSWCSTCILSDCLGYFGSNCLGACVYRNTCCGNGYGCGMGCLQVTNGFARVPYEQPLHCSGIFSDDQDMKCLFEYMMGCHCIGCALWCNRQCDIDKFVYCLFVPCFYETVDITCQYTLGCTGVYTWGTNCLCSRNRWQVWDPSTVCVCHCEKVCCTRITKSVLCMISCDCRCTWGAFQTCVDLGCGWRPFDVISRSEALFCENKCTIPTMLMCICTETLFNGDPNHRNFTNPSSRITLLGYDRPGYIGYDCVGGCLTGSITDVDNYRKYFNDGWYSNQALPCCCMPGMSGPMKYWFDKYYAGIL